MLRLLCTSCRLVGYLFQNVDISLFLAQLVAFLGSGALESLCNQCTALILNVKKIRLIHSVMHSNLLNIFPLHPSVSLETYPD